MAYGIDFRRRVLEYVKEGHTRKETAALFNISINTLYSWEKKERELGHLERKKRVAKSRKIPLDKLQKFVEEHPDAFLREIAEHFSCSIPSVCAALKQINITLKKITSYK